MNLTPETRMALFNMSHGHEETASPMPWELFKRAIRRPEGIERAINLAFDQHPNMELSRFCHILMADVGEIRRILMGE